MLIREARLVSSKEATSKAATFKSWLLRNDTST